VEFSKDLIKSDRYERSVALEFTTTSSEGLLVWHGQENNKSGKDKDYLSLACEYPVWKTWHMLQKVMFCQMSKKINKFYCPSVNSETSAKFF